MPVHKKKSNGFASILIQDRFTNPKTCKKLSAKQSITELTGMSILNEKLTIENKHIYNSKDTLDNDSEVEANYNKLVLSLDYSKTIPPRVPHGVVDKGEYKLVELDMFNRWKYLKKDFIFERNLEIWRQLWITCERATVIVQILDSRNPCALFNEDILKMYPNKKHILFFNKSDLVESPQDSLNKIIDARGNLDGISGYYSYSSKRSCFDFPLSGIVGLIGYPNVGKSSTINLILKEKRVKVSSTPGKTKYIQTIETPDFTVLDCPGFVFPKHSKIDLILMGILNIDQITDLGSHEKYILSFIGIEKLRKFYNVPESQNDFLTAMCLFKGWIKTKCLKTMIKDFANGTIRYD